MQNKDNIHRLYHFLDLLYKDYYFHPDIEATFAESPASFAELLLPLPYWDARAKYPTDDCRKAVIAKLGRVIRDMLMRPASVARKASDNRSAYPILKSLRPLSLKNMEALVVLTGISHRQLSDFYEMAKSNFQAISQPTSLPDSDRQPHSPDADNLSAIVRKLQLVEVDGGQYVHAASGFRKQNKCCFYISISISILFHAESSYKDCQSRMSRVNAWVREFKPKCERHARTSSLFSHLKENVDYGPDTHTSLDMADAVVKYCERMAVAVLFDDDDGTPCLCVYKGKSFEDSSENTILILLRNEHYVACLPSSDPSLRPTLTKITSLLDESGLHTHYYENDWRHLHGPEIVELTIEDSVVDGTCDGECGSSIALVRPRDT